MHTEEKKLHHSCADPKYAYVKIPVLAVIKQVHQDLRALLQQRADVTRRIGTVRRTVVGLASIFGENLLNDELKQLLNR